MLIPAVFAALAVAQPEADPGDAGEARFLTNPVQLTFAKDFVKAGESYFSPDDDLVVFQGVPVPPEGEEPSPHYGMYVGRFTGGSFESPPSRVSPDGSANTCGWFAPQDPEKPGQYKLIFGSTVEAPEAATAPGYQRGTSKYRWSFPSNMRIAFRHLAYSEDIRPKLFVGGIGYPMESEGCYTAECSYSPDGRHVLFAQVDNDKTARLGRPDADIWVMPADSGPAIRIVEAEGYDGGPFFSPDGAWICYRSDRRGDNLLQLFVAELAYDDSGAITGIKREIQLTDNQHVNWAPFWHPSGEFLIYASSEVSHRNYEVFAIRFDAENPGPTTPVRITFAEGFDGLPVFDSDGDRMMWTAQRGDDTRWGGRASSQLWIADFDADAVRAALDEANH
ncbi:MAG: TolB family protein [Phycisphaerales bacterium]